MRRRPSNVRVAALYAMAAAALAASCELNNAGRGADGASPSGAGPDAAVPTGADSGPAATRLVIGRVVDGDTVVLYASADQRAPDGKPLDGEHIRLIGINAPEISHGNDGGPSQLWGDESKTWMTGQAAGKPARLDYDTQNGRALRDTYGRLLAYLYLETSGLFLNQESIRTGNACILLAFPFRYRTQFVAAEAEARSARRGLWGAGGTCSQ